MSALPVAASPLWYPLLACGCAVGACEDHPSSLAGTPLGETLAGHDVVVWVRAVGGWPYVTEWHEHPALYAAGCGRTMPLSVGGVECWSAEHGDGAQILFLPDTMSFGSD